MTSSILHQTQVSDAVPIAGNAAPNHGSGRLKRRALNTASTSTKSSSKTSVSPETRKLRASCDGCYLAKIKCGKERPQCSRCANHGMSCQYSASQRMGKPRRLPLAKSAMTPKQPHSPASSLLTQGSRQDQEQLIQDVVSVGDQETASLSSDKAVNTPMFEWPFNLTPPTSETSGSEATVPITPGLPFPWNQALYGLPQQRFETSTTDTTPANALHAPSHFQSPSSFSPTTELSLLHPHSAARPINTEPRLQQPTPVTSTTSTHKPSASPPCRRAGLSPPQRQATAASMQTQQPHITHVDPALTHTSTMSKPSTPSSCTCNITAFENLHDLHDRSSTTTTTPFDAILAKNKEILSCIAQLLNCTICATMMDSSLIFTLAASIAQLLSSYASILLRTPPSPKQESASATIGGNNHSSKTNMLHTEVQEQQNRQESTPVLLGAYRLEGEAEEMVKMHVVVNELRKVDAVLVRFGERFRALRKAENGYEAAFYADVVVFLRKRVRGLVEELRKGWSVEFEGLE